MSELSVGSLSGLAANSYVVDVASGSTLDVTNATGTIPGAVLPAGSILQVVSTTKTDAYSSSVSSNVFVTPTGMSATITPSSSSNKILISCHLGIVASSDQTVLVGVALNNGTSRIAIGDAAGSRVSITAGGRTSSGTSDVAVTTPSFQFLDSPNTVSSITYSVELYNMSGVTRTLYLNRPESNDDNGNRQRAVSTITLMEVAG